MAKDRKPFVPIEFSYELRDSGNFRADAGRSTLRQWCGTHWEAVSEPALLKRAVDWVEATWAGVDASKVQIKNAQSARDLAHYMLDELPEPRPDDPLIIPCLNGAVHVDAAGAASLQPHDKRHSVRHALRCAYAPGSECSIFDAFLRTILPDEAVRMRVQEFVGYTLLSDTRFQRAAFWLGTGANGKGVLANVVQALHQHVAAVQLDSLSGFGLAPLVGAQLIFCDEAPQRGLNEAALKSAIAGEMMQIDRKYHDGVSIKLLGKWLVLGNSVPAIRDQSAGFWRRWDIVPFSVTIPEAERDPLLAQKIIAGELSGVLNWALEGLERLLARGRFDETMPQPMQEVMAAARLETDSVRAWVDDRDIALGTTTDTAKDAVYQAYAAWCEGAGMCSLSSPRFWSRLPDVLSGLVEARVRIAGGGRIRVCNVRLG